MVSPGHEAKAPPIPSVIAMPHKVRFRFLALLIVSSTMLCAGCATHLPKSQGCMDKPLRHYMIDGAGED